MVIALKEEPASIRTHHFQDREKIKAQDAYATGEDAIFRKHHLYNYLLVPATAKNIRDKTRQLVLIISDWEFSTEEMLHDYNPQLSREDIIEQGRFRATEKSINNKTVASLKDATTTREDVRAALEAELEQHFVIPVERVASSPYNPDNDPRVKKFPKKPL